MFDLVNEEEEEEEEPDVSLEINKTLEDFISRTNSRIFDQLTDQCRNELFFSLNLFQIREY